MRRASISEPSDTDFEPRFIPPKQGGFLHVYLNVFVNFFHAKKRSLWLFFPSGIVLPHQQEIERLSSFREQLGEDWLRYQHHLDLGSPSVTTQAPPSPLSNGVEAPELLLPPKGQDEDQDLDADTESTLQWPGHDSQPAESTLENTTGDASMVTPDGKSSVNIPGGKSPHPKGEEEEEEEDLGGVEVEKKIVLQIYLSLLVAILLYRDCWRFPSFIDFFPDCIQFNYFSN